MVDVQTISVVIASVSVVIGMIFGVEQLRDLKKTRQTEIAMQFYDVFTQKEFLRNIADVLFTYDFKTYEEWLENYGPRANPEAASTKYSVLFTMNTIGVYLKDRLLDFDTLFKIWDPPGILQYGKKFKPLIERWREYYQYPQHFESFEYLVNEVKKKYPQITIPSR